MTARNGASGYGWVTRLLHWMTLVLLLAQFVLGYAMEGLADWLLGEMDSLGHGRGDDDERLTELDRRIERLAELALYWLLVLVPASGLALLFLSGKEREVSHGEWQPPYDLVGDDVLLALHVAGHIAFYVVLLAHAGIAVRRRTLGRIF